jgi:hypothetical protein
VQPPVPSSTISIGRGPRFRPPPSGAPSMTTAWPLPVSATNDMVSGPDHLTSVSILLSSYQCWEMTLFEQNAQNL